MTAVPGSGNPAPRPPHRLPRPSRARAARLFRAIYGESPLHLLVLLASFALCGYAAAKLLVGDWRGIVEWFVGAAVIHDLLFVPLYGGADWVLHRGIRAGRMPVVPDEPADGRAEDAPAGRMPAAADEPADGQAGVARERSARRIAVVNHIRVPTFLSLLLLLVYWPLISQRSGPYYALTTRLSPDVFLGRWLLVTAVLFAASGLLFAVRWWRGRRRQRTGHRSASRSQE